jgi:carboxymethylenebutenolidase
MREETVTLDTPGGQMATYLAAPEEWPPGPGVVVVQEWWGLNDNIKEIARRLAAEGFAAVAPDLYRGKQADEPDEARKLAMSLDSSQALEDLKGTVGWLLEEGATAVGVMGFCMGGSLTFEMAFQDHRLKAAVPFYGLAEVFEGRNLHAPVLAHFGSEDQWPAEELAEVRRYLAAQPHPTHLHVYEGAPHAFMNETRESYRPEDAKIAWARTLEFLREHLGSPAGPTA